VYSLLQVQLADVRHGMQLTVDNQSRLIAARNELRSVAVHGSMLYSLLSTMSAVNHMYQLSLQQFLQILRLSLQRLICCLAVNNTDEKRRINVTQSSFNHLKFLLAPTFEIRSDYNRLIK